MPVSSPSRIGQSSRLRPRPHPCVALLVLVVLIGGMLTAVGWGLGLAVARLNPLNGHVWMQLH